MSVLLERFRACNFGSNSTSYVPAGIIFPPVSKLKGTLTPPCPEQKRQPR
jgi:hypothetical protein